MSRMMVTGFAEIEKNNNHQLTMVFEEVNIDDVLRETYRKSRKKKPLPDRPCKCCGNMFTPTHGSQGYCSKTCKRKAKSEQALASYHKIRDNEPKLKEKEGDCNRKCSLCMECKNSVPNPQKRVGCSWSMSFVPVNGWEAIKKMKGNCESYKVLNCPKFVRG